MGDGGTNRGGVMVDLVASGSSGFCQGRILRRPPGVQAAVINRVRSGGRRPDAQDFTVMIS